MFCFQRTRQQDQPMWWGLCTSHAGNMGAGGRAGCIPAGTPKVVRGKTRITPKAITRTATPASFTPIATSHSDGNHTIACDWIIHQQRTTIATKLHGFDHGPTHNCLIENAYLLTLACCCTLSNEITDRRKAMKLGAFMLNHSSIV